MKKVLAVLLVIVVVIGGLLLALPHLVPMERIEREIVTRFQEATGRELTYREMRFYALPNVGILLEGVTVSNAPWAAEPTMVALDELSIRLSAKALLKKRVEISRFVLKRPVIHLETASGGRANWDFAAAGAAEKKAEKQVEENKEKKEAGGPGFDLSFGEVAITAGEITYRDGAAGTVEKVGDVNLTVTMPDAAAALNLDGTMTVRGRKVAVALSVDHPMALMRGERSTGSLNVKADAVKADVAGDFATSGTLLKGRVNVDIPSLPALAGWLSGGAEPALPVRRFQAASTAEVSAGRIALGGAKLMLDDMSGGGDLRVDMEGRPRPFIHARLSLDKVDLDRILNQAAPASGAASGRAAPAAPAGGWDETPIDFSALKSADADVAVETRGFRVKGIDIGGSTMTVQLKNGKLDADIGTVTLFGGTAQARAGVNAAAAPATVQATAVLKGVQAKPVLETFAGFDKIGGTAEADISLTASGASQKAMVFSLGGKGRVVFRDGAIEGIDIVNLARAIQNKLGELGVGKGKTDFVEMGGAFTITRGVVTNDDFRLRGPLVQATGRGTVDLPQKNLRYRVEPVLTASSGEAAISGLRVPVDVVGPFDNIKIRPDYAAILQDALKNPGQLKDSIAPVKDNIRDMRDAIKEDPARAIENLIGGGGLFGR